MNRHLFALPVAAAVLAATAGCPAPSDTTTPPPPPATVAPTVRQPAEPPTATRPPATPRGRTQSPPPRRAPATTATAGETDPTEPVTGVDYDDCDELRHDYPAGVERTHPAYSPALDTDSDGTACEAGQ